MLHVKTKRGWRLFFSSCDATEDAAHTSLVYHRVCLIFDRSLLCLLGLLSSLQSAWERGAFSSVVLCFSLFSCTFACGQEENTAELGRVATKNTHVFVVTDCRQAPTRFCFALRTVENGQTRWNHFCAENDVDHQQWMAYLQVASDRAKYAALTPPENIGTRADN